MLHDLLKGQVIFLKLLAFLLQLLLDVLIANENALEIHPFLLHLQPHLNALRNEIEPALPISDLGAECACVLARGHCLQVG